jgi:hypothetical protein
MVGVKVMRWPKKNREIHERDCFNLNPAANVMNPRAEALLSSRSGRRPSLGYPGDKYEMGLEAIEEIEVIAAELAAEVFDAKYAEIRVASGAMANLYAFMATCRRATPSSRRPPPSAAMSPTTTPGCAGLYGLRILPAPVAADGYTVDTAALEFLARTERPRSSPSAAASTSTNTRWPSCAPSPTRWARRSSSTRRINAGSSRARVEEPARRGRAPDDDEHLQEPRRTRRRADRDQ